jgi:hypothetical protein
MADSHSDSTGIHDAHQPPNRLNIIVTTYAISVLHRSPIFNSRERIGVRAELGAALLICLALIMTVYVTFDNGVYSHGVLSEVAANNLMVFLMIVLLVVGIIYLGMTVVMMWRWTSRWEIAGIKRHLYVLVRPHDARRGERAEEEVLVGRQNMV